MNLKKLLILLSLAVPMTAQSSDLSPRSFSEVWKGSTCEKLLLSNRRMLTRGIEDSVFGLNLEVKKDLLIDYSNDQEEVSFPKPSLREIINPPANLIFMLPLEDVVRFRIDKEGDQVELSIFLYGQKVNSYSFTAKPNFYFPSGYVAFLDMPKGMIPPDKGYFAHVIRVSQQAIYPLENAAANKYQLGLAFSFKPKFLDKNNPRNSDPEFGDEQIQSIRLVQSIPDEHTENWGERYFESETEKPARVGVRTLLELAPASPGF